MYFDCRNPEGEIKAQFEYQSCSNLLGEKRKSHNAGKKTTAWTEERLAEQNNDNRRKIKKQQNVKGQ